MNACVCALGVPEKWEVVGILNIQYAKNSPSRKSFQFQCKLVFKKLHERLSQLVSVHVCVCISNCFVYLLVALTKQLAEVESVLYISIDNVLFFFRKERDFFSLFFVKKKSLGNVKI